MRLAIGALVDLGGCEIGDTRLLPRKTGEGSEGQEHGAKRNAAIGEALRIDAAEPCADGGPAGDGFARAEGFIENVVNKTRRRIDLRQCVQGGNRVGDARDKGSAARARVHMRVKFVLLGGGEKAVEVVVKSSSVCSQVQFIRHPAKDPSPRAVAKKLQTAPLPIHAGRTPICCRMRANSMRPRLILDFTVPSARENPLNLAIFQLLQVAQDDGFT